MSASESECQSLPSVLKPSPDHNVVASGLHPSARERHAISKGESTAKSYRFDRFPKLVDEMSSSWTELNDTGGSNVRPAVSVRVLEKPEARLKCSLP
eukprot:381398-Rhodomonas_salina.2